MNKISIIFFSIVSFFLIITACSKMEIIRDDAFNPPMDKITKLESSTQRIGDADRGRKYLIEGDYVDSGIPLSIYKMVLGNQVEDYLGRDGINKGIGHEYNAFRTDEGVELVSPNCLQCHSSVFDGRFVLGLGNTSGNFTMDQSMFAGVLEAVVTSQYPVGTPEHTAFLPFSKAIKAIGSKIVTKTIGSNPADKIAAVLASHRNRDDLSWREEEMLDIPDEVIPTDVPAWWLLKKKNAMFYTAVGRGDYARISMASSMLTVVDSMKAREVDENFVDVIAYINQLEAPAYPKPINQEMAEIGEELFLDNCSSCHGTYGALETYPNLLVDLDLIQTDSMLVYANFGLGRFVDWYNTSWFGKGEHAAILVPERGYVAPPLDGIWATAPYFHNGSVPTLEKVLNSSSRPEVWSKEKTTDNYYNYDEIGIDYEVLDTKSSIYHYDTKLMGHGNSGHYFGDKLAVEERKNIIEYLKTL